MGHSCGLRSGISFDWVKNLKSKKLAPTELEKIEQDASAAYALFWNLTHAFAPPEVIEDFDNYLKNLGIKRMDGGGTMKHDIETGKGEYTISVPGYEFTFHGAQLAPPTGICAHNYCQ